MDAAEWDQLETLVEQAVALPPGERAAFLERACGTDTVLRAEVASLLSFSEEAPAYFQRLAQEALAPPLAALAREPSGKEQNGQPLQVGQRVSHYQIQEKLGGGGMGLVYKARDLRLERAVALKFLPLYLSTDEEAKRRFLHEARAASALDHPNICTIHEIGETEEGQLFIVMPCYEGETLKKKIARGPLQVEEALGYAVQMAEGLSAAHEAGIVHRDVKPANIMVTTKDVAKVVDFGIAKLVGQDLTRTGVAVGTVAYMSPEQARGEEVDARTDLWSLGVVFYEMLVGQKPFRGEYEQGVLYAILHEAPPPVRARRPEVPEHLERVVLRMLRKEPTGRYQHMGELLSDLRALGEESAPVRLQTSATVARLLRRPILLRSAGALLLALLVFGAGHLLAGRSTALDSVAVLPLANLSADPNQEYFSDGMTGALIAELGKIQALRVISRTSVMRYKQTQKPLPEIAEELNVTAVVEGSVQQAGDRVRITVQLIEAEKERHLWSESYEREMRDVLSLQREVALAIAQEVEAKLTPQERARLAEAPEVDEEAYLLYLRGQHFRDRDGPADFRQAVEYFEQAIAKDPDLAPAYSGLAVGYVLLGVWGALPREEALAKGRQAVTRALALDEESAEAHIALGQILEFFEWDWAGAERSFRQAIEGNPGSREAHRVYGWLLVRLGRFEEALAEMQKAQELDPLSVVANNAIAVVYLYSRQYKKAIAAYREVLELDPSHVMAHIQLGLAYLQEGRYEEAVTEYEQAVTLSGESSIALGVLGHAYAAAGKREEARKVLGRVEERARQRQGPSVAVALVYAGLEEKEQALAWLERAYEERDPLLTYLKIAPAYDPLRSEPRFQALLEKVGLDA